MVFFSRDKEPKLYNIPVLTAAAAVLLLFVSRMADPQRLIFANGVLTVYFTLTAVFLFIAFRRQAAFNPYSYNIILYSGFGLYAAAMVMIHARLTLYGILHPELLTDKQMMIVIIKSPGNFLLLTSPVPVVLSVITIIATVVLIADSKEVKFQNIFGILLPAFSLAGLAGVVFFRLLSDSAGKEYLFGDLLLILSSAVYLYFECMFFGTLSAILLTSNYHIRTSVDNVIVLGCGLEPDGTPSMILQKRLNTALSFAAEQKKTFGKELNLILSGGQGIDEIRSEASSMKEYLLSHGFPESRIFLEETSVRTKENMSNSAEVIRSLRPDGAAAFVTTNFHVFRSGIYAVCAGLKAVGISSPTTCYYWVNAVAREFVGITAEKIKIQAVILFFLVVIYGMLTIMTYKIY